MIEIVELSRINNKTAYSVNSYIPRSEKFSFSLNEFKIDLYKNVHILEHLRKLSSYTDYLIHVFKIYEIIISEIQKRDELESEIKRKYEGYQQWPDLRTINDEEYGLLNYKEKLAAIRIRCGRCIHEELKNFLNYSLCDESIKKLVKETDNKLIKISEPDYEEYDTQTYQKVYSAEDSVFYFYPEDSKACLEEIIPKYITSKEYFTNLGTSYFALDTKSFLYLVGNKRGLIKGREAFVDFKIKYQKQVFDKLCDDFLQLKNEITMMIKNLEQKEPLLDDSSLSKQIKEQIFALRSNKVFISICEHVSKASTILEFLIQKEYLCYDLKKCILIKTDSFTDSCIYELIHDDDLPFHNYFRLLHKQYDLLFGKDVNGIGINKTSRGKWFESKKIILNYLNNTSI